MNRLVRRPDWVDQDPKGHLHGWRAKAHEIIFEAETPAGFRVLRHTSMRCARLAVVGMLLSDDTIFPFFGLDKELDVRFSMFYDPVDYVDTLAAVNLVHEGAHRRVGIERRSVDARQPREQRRRFRVVAVVRVIIRRAESRSVLVVCTHDEFVVDPGAWFPGVSPDGRWIAAAQNHQGTTHLVLVPAGGSRMPATFDTVRDHEHAMHMTGSEVFKFATRTVVAMNTLKETWRIPIE